MSRQHRAQQTGRGHAGSSGRRQVSQWLGFGVAILAAVLPWPRGDQDSAQRPFSTRPRSLHNVSTVNFRYAGNV